MTPDMNRAQRSTLHASMVSALDLPKTFAEDEEQYRLQAWCEIVALGEYPEQVLALANYIADFLGENDYVEVDASELCEPRQNIIWALRLNGIRPRPSGLVSTVWTNAPLGARGKSIKLPAWFD